MKKLVAAAVAACIAVAAIPTGASAHYFYPKFYPKYHPIYKKVTPAQGKKFGGGSSAPWMVIGCAGGVVLAALAANYRDNRQLTADEAWSCGTLFLFSTPKNKKNP